MFQQHKFNALFGCQILVGPCVVLHADAQFNYIVCCISDCWSLLQYPFTREKWKYVTGFGKTLRMGFSQKIEFEAWLISSTIELTRVQVLGRSCAWLWRYSALFAITPHPQ